MGGGGEWTMGQGDKISGVAKFQEQQNLCKIRLPITDKDYQNTGYQCY
jgi:hypothetical protein